MAKRKKPKKRFTDRMLRTMKAPAKGREDTWDTEVRGFGVRVSSQGRKSFILMVRYPGSENPERRPLGDFPSTSLAEARKKAQRWRDLIEQGKDPAIEEERQRAQETQRQAITFAAVAEDFKKLKLAGERRGADVARDLKVFIDAWGKRPITDVTEADVVGIIEGYHDRRAHGRNLLGYCRRLFKWAKNRKKYGPVANPCADIEATAFFGEKVKRKRTLNDTELRAFWKATETLGYPYGPLFKLMLLTGQRETVVSRAAWNEFGDLSKKVWTIPPERMKMDDPHIAPLSDDAVALLKSLPQFSGPYLFTTTYGRKPVNGFSKAKERLDRAMGDPAPFVLHDLRRTMRTHLSAIPGVPTVVAELVIAHKQQGLHAVYDQHSYLEEKRHALDAWAARLRGIVDPAPANVVQGRWTAA